MAKRLLLLAVLAVFLLSCRQAFCEEADFTKEKIVAIATEKVKAEGISITDVDIVYDEGGKLWSEKIGYAIAEDTTPNHGILKKGFLKNYRIVYFDFKEPLPDIWVYIDKDTGEVLEVYRE